MPDSEIDIDQIFNDEVCELNKRRQINGSERIKKMKGCGEFSIGPHNKLIGLALSGGGVRSAATCLGAMQALDDRNILRDVDYLSTVSGGGYTGAGICALMQYPNPEGAEQLKNNGYWFPYKHQIGKVENEEFKHIRRNSNFLRSHRFLEKFALPVHYSRGIIQNTLIITPYILLLVVLFVLLYSGMIIKLTSQLSLKPWIESDALLACFTFTFMGVIILAAAYTIQGILLSNRLLNIRSFFTNRPQIATITNYFVNAAHKIRSNKSNTVKLQQIALSAVRNNTKLLFAAVLLVLIIEIQPLSVLSYNMIDAFQSEITGPVKTSKSLLGLFSASLAILSVLICLYLLARRGSKFVKPISNYSAGFIGWFLLWLYWLVLCKWAINWRNTPDAIKSLANKISPIDNETPNIAVSLIANSHEHLALIISRVSRAPEAAFIATRADLKNVLNVSAAYFYVAATLLIVTWFFNVNNTSLHRFYRNRIGECFLRGYPDISGNIYTQVSTTKLSELSSTSAPYLLVNTTLNITSKKNGYVSRQAKSFVLTRKFSGTLGNYCHTKDFESADPEMNLGAAVAISGAAASPYMGELTNRPLSALLTLLNIRLGYWAPNPAKVNAFSLRQNIWNCLARITHSWPGFARSLVNTPLLSPYQTPTPRIINAGPWCLLRELTGLIGEKYNNVYLSDGGHFDNLGVYELLQRQCMTIYVIDAERDPNIHFPGASNILRLARTDLGFDITFKTPTIKNASEQGFVDKHVLEGIIHYGPSKHGRLFIFKSSISGDENLYVNEYGKSNVEFPHENTSDQFFSEPQFEAYRALGYHIIMRSLNTVIKPNT